MSSLVVLQYSEEDRISLLKEYERTPETLKEDIAAIRTWILKQPHLPEVTADNIIERLLVMNKFRMETTKQNIDMYYTIRSLAPELYQFPPTAERILKTANVLYILPMPKLTKDLCRVIIFKMNSPDPDDFDVNACLARQEFIREIQAQEDYTSSYIVILDMGNATLSHLIKLTPTILKKQQVLLEQVYTVRIKVIYLVNVSPTLDKIISFIKQFVPSKMRDRMQIFRDMKCLEDAVSKEVLPVEFGGSEGSLKEINEIWNQKILEYKPRFEQLQVLKVNEDLRPEKIVNSDILGLQGNFRKLNVD